jgi:Fe2+ or Zn2+ uptake regulation protein
MRARVARGVVGHLALRGVYEALYALTSAGLVGRIEPAGSPARYEAKVADDHTTLLITTETKEQVVEYWRTRHPELGARIANGPNGG